MPRTAPIAGTAPGARKARLVAVVLVGTVLLWLAAQLLGGQLGLPGRYAFLFDFAALAAFLWSFIVTFQLWQARDAHPPRPPKGD